jgi:PHD/YefM family antitoxin component YafN of YafNO toxin-antitoxin module
MFRINQIVSSSQFIRHFRDLANHLSKSCEPLLITQKNGRFLVVMDAEFFEGLLAATADASPHHARIMQQTSE